MVAKACFSLSLSRIPGEKAHRKLAQSIQSGATAAGKSCPPGKNFAVKPLLLLEAPLVPMLLGETTVEVASRRATETMADPDGRAGAVRPEEDWQPQEVKNQVSMTPSLQKEVKWGRSMLDETQDLMDNTHCNALRARNGIVGHAVR